MRAVARAFVRRSVVYGGLLAIGLISGDARVGTLLALTSDPNNPVATENGLGRLGVTPYLTWEIPGADQVP